MRARPAARRLQAEQAAATRRDPDRTAAVVRVRDRHEAGRDGARRAARRSAGAARRGRRGSSSVATAAARPRARCRARWCSTCRRSRSRRASTARRGGCRPPACSCMRLSGHVPCACGTPPTVAPRSLIRIGTPRNGPSAAASQVSRACSYIGMTTAPSSGLWRSIRAIAASTSSRGVAAPLRISSACAVASRSARCIPAEGKRDMPRTCNPT